MAEIIAYDLLKVVLKTLATEAVKKIVRSRGIQSELKNLERRLLQIQNVLNDASQKEVTDEAVKLWLNSLQHLAYDIDDLLDGLATDAMKREFKEEESRAFTNKVTKLIPNCCKNFTLSEKMSHKLDDIMTKLEDLEKEKIRLGLIVINDMPKNVNRKYQTSVVDVSTIVGRQMEKEKLVHDLLTDESCDKSFSIVPIVGMGGVGKTTLAKLLYNDNRVMDHFELKAWVCVSDNFDSFSISKVIFQSVAGETKKFEDLNLLQVDLKNLLIGKRFLLVLDDVWSESYEDWVTLVAPFHACAPGSKVIMTTRKEQLLKALGCRDLNILESLSHDNAVTLFSQNALGLDNFDSHPTLKTHGEDIVKKCGGLPLALVALGRLLRTKENEEEYWKEVLNSEIWRLKDGGGIVPALRLSYHDLSARLKRLFAYCSFFPKDYIFDKRELVLLWMAEGFLHHSNPNMSTEEHFGDNCFEELLSRSFFQHAPNDKSLFMMHDLMNDLATSIAGEFFVRLGNEMEKDKGSKAFEKCRHMSFVRERYVTYNKFEEAFERARSLRTFLGTYVEVIDDWKTFYLSNKILVDLLPKLLLLRVLNLSNFEISEVPDTIGRLRHLRYLNLSQTIITQLPESVCNLYNLQTLILYGCDRLVNLPINLSKLKNLRHLDIRKTSSLDKTPFRIGKLNNLQTLSKIILGGEDGFGIIELKELKNVCGEISIEGLDTVQNAIDVREVNFFHKRLSKLELIWGNVIDSSRKHLREKDVFDGLKPHNANLKELRIESYGGTELSNWVVDPSFNRLSHVTIHGCKKCTCLPSLGQLPSLEELFIEGMDEVNNVGVEFLGVGVGVSFPVLKILSFGDMKGWESWSTKSGVAFPCLEKLVVQNCPNLVQVSIEALASLRHLQIRKCGHSVLKSLVQAASSSVIELDIASILVCEKGMVDVNNVGFEFHGTGVSFPVLKIIRFKDMKGWESWSTKSEVVFPCLEKLVIEECHNLVQVSIEAMPSLRHLDIRECDHIVLTSLVRATSSVTKLYLNCISGLNDEVWRGVGEHLRAVEELSIKKCDEMRYMWESEAKASTVLVSLRKLEVMECENLVSLGEREEDDDDDDDDDKGRGNLITSLRILHIESCKRMEHCICPNNIETLDIKYCSSLTDVSFSSRGGGQNLNSLEILGYKGGDKSRMLINDNNKVMPLLQHLEISYFLNLKFILELSCFLHLTSLEIWNCESLESIPDQQFPNLTSLTRLQITKCPRMDGSFPRGLWPPRLEYLTIGGLKKPISEWGPQNFPPSLFHLDLHGENDVVSISDSQLCSLLPSSLTFLRLWELSELETISMGLQHLTSLKHLEIWKCPKLKDLPEMLFPSLHSLTIYGCPTLEERCSKSESKSKRGSYNYWPLISHIPQIFIR